MSVTLDRTKFFTLGGQEWLSLCLFPKFHRLLSKHTLRCVKARTLMKIVWGLILTIAVATIIIGANFTPEEVAADPILLGIAGTAVAMGWAALACFYMAVVSRD